MKASRLYLRVPDGDTDGSSAFLANEHEYLPAALIWPRILLLLNSAGFIVNIILAFIFVIQYKPAGSLLENSLQTDYAPLRGLTKYLQTYTDLSLGVNTPFTNTTGPDTDALWDSISAPPGKVGLLRVQKDELQALNQTSVPLRDGTGYIAVVDVFHQLHCLNLIRLEILDPLSPENERESPFWRDHLAHCIDSIKTSLQCHADTSLITFKWIQDYSTPWPDFRTTRMCRNWDDILDWARDHSIDGTKKGMVRHPVLGDEVKLENPLTRPGGLEYIDIEF